MSTKSLMHIYDKRPSILEWLTLFVITLSSVHEVHGLVAVDSIGFLSPQSSQSCDNENLTNPTRNEIQLLAQASTSNESQPQKSHFRNYRRNFLMAIATPVFFTPPQESKAITLFDGSSNRRQLELCLVTILRTQYWAMNVAKSIKSKLFAPTAENVEGMSDSQRKQPYLEARLGAKALLTQKIGGGANANVVKLASFHIKECLDDGKYWCNERFRSGQNSFTINDAKRICNTDLVLTSENLVEALASLVEFDGLETTIDPSPRSSLMLSMYTPQKGQFVYRTLMERVIPSCEKYLNVFGDKRGVLLEFVRREYSEEIPFEVLERLYGGSQGS